MDHRDGDRGPEVHVRSAKLLLHSLLAATTVLLLASAAGAASVSTLLTPFTGSEIEVELVLSDDAGDGTISGSLEVVSGVGDLRGLFLDIVDDSLLPGLLVTGADVTDFKVGDQINLRRGVNLNGGGTPCPCDLAIVFGSPGIGQNDIGFTEFSIAHDSEALSLALFAEQFAGARVTSVGEDYDGPREGSSKLVAMVPEPTTGVLLSLGLVALALPSRRSRRRAA
jgi:hypothetical protein